MVGPSNNGSNHTKNSESLGKHGHFLDVVLNQPNQKFFNKDKRVQEGDPIYFWLFQSQLSIGSKKKKNSINVNRSEKEGLQSIRGCVHRIRHLPYMWLTGAKRSRFEPPGVTTKQGQNNPCTAKCAHHSQERESAFAGALVQGGYGF